MKTALFSVSYAGLWGQHYLKADEFIYKAAALGYDGVLLMAKEPHLFPSNVQDTMMLKVEEALSKTGIELVGLAAYNDFLMPSPLEIPVLDFQLSYIRQCCEMTASLKGELVRIFTGYRYPDSSEGESWRKIVASLRICGDIAGEYGIHIAVQNHHDIAVGSEEMLLLINEVNHPFVSAGYDAWSPFLRKENIQEGAGKMAEKAIMTIAANYKVYPRYTYHPENVNYSRVFPDTVRAVPMNQGDIDYDTFLLELESNRFTGWVVYEMCSPILGGGSEENLDKYADIFLKYMSKFSRRSVNL
ncbi:MAG: sugar phosphate isomerase/epimerase [Bacteroidetes bacterium]|nr:sugar phosphate isomerase/epimerase [Bacteroidota bacterium]